MKLRRSLFASGAPVALALGCAGPALAIPAGQGHAVPPVSVRVEGPTGTLLATKTVTAPASGSITLGGTPKGTCPADSAAGALRTAVHGRWDGSYYKGLGIDISTILGTKLSYAKGSYWGFYVNDRFASEGVCDTRLTRGESLLFAPVPAKGTAPRPLVLRAPATVKAGRPFSVRTFAYTGKGAATKPVTRVSFREAGTVTKGTSRGRASVGPTSPRGVTTLTTSGSGTLTLTASAKGYIRSAAATIKVTK